METILSRLLDKWPSLLLILVTAVIVWFVVRWYYRRFKPVEDKAKKIDTLPCAKNEELLSKIATKLEENSNKTANLPCASHNEMFHEIKEELIAIRTYLTTKYPTAAGAFSQKKSPRELNEAGLQLLADINGEEFLNNNKEILIKGIDDKTPKTALDVEESALEVLYSLVDNDMFIGMKNWVYNSPSRKLTIDGVEKEYTVTMNDVCFVLSLPLRNMYLKQHPELQQ